MTCATHALTDLPVARVERQELLALLLLFLLLLDDDVARLLGLVDALLLREGAAVLAAVGEGLEVPARRLQRLARRLAGGCGVQVGTSARCAIGRMVRTLADTAGRLRTGVAAYPSRCRG